jgi:hypothetical protein
LHEQLSQSEKALVEKLVKLMLPQGGDSLLLPPGAGFFSGKITAMLNEMQSLLQSHIGVLFSRERKIDLLCRAYAYLYIWICKGCPSKVSPELTVPQKLLERLQSHLQRPIEILFPHVEKYARFFPREKIAKKIVEYLGGLLNDVSLENLLLRMLAHTLASAGSYTSRTIKDLDFITDKLCSDEPVVRAIIKKCAPEESLVGEGNMSNPLDLLFKGLQSTLTQKAALQAIPWKDIITHLLEEVRFFVLSFYWNKSCVEGVERALDYINSPPSTTIT